MDFRKSIITTLLVFIGVTAPYVSNAEENSYQTENVNVLAQRDLSSYMDNLKEKLQSVWQPPDFMEEGHVRVYFKLNRQGQVMNAYIIESSGDDIYDESALEAIKNAAPFGDFPEDSLREMIAIKYSFDTILIEEERMNGYYELAKANARNNPQKALEYLNMAISQVGGEEASYFLYKRRAEIKEILGDSEGAEQDWATYNLYTQRTNIKRLHLLKHLVETKPSAYLYHYLAYAYEQVGDYDNAIAAINIAIANSPEANMNLIRYRDSLVNKRENKAVNSNISAF